jgi:hypothetical protein
VGTQYAEQLIRELNRMAYHNRTLQASIVEENVTNSRRNSPKRNKKGDDQKADFKKARNGDRKKKRY